MVAASPGAIALESVEALKRVKATENEWDTRLGAARKEAETTLERLRSQAAAAVKEAQTEADRDRVARVVQARAETEVQAEGIVAEGRKAADAALAADGRRPADKKDAILSVVLGTFGPD